MDANSFTTTWAGQTPYGGEGNPGSLNWVIDYIRGPTCEAHEGDFENWQGDAEESAKIWQ